VAWIPFVRDTVVVQKGHSEICGILANCNRSLALADSCGTIGGAESLVFCEVKFSAPTCLPAGRDAGANSPLEQSRRRFLKTANRSYL
jgi:hypothetical protein